MKSKKDTTEAEKEHQQTVDEVLKAMFSTPTPKKSKSKKKKNTKK